MKSTCLQHPLQTSFERAIKGNALAQAVPQACMLESIERRADLAFNHKHTEEEYLKGLQGGLNRLQCKEFRFCGKRRKGLPLSTRPSTVRRKSSTH